MELRKAYCYICGQLILKGDQYGVSRANGNFYPYHFDCYAKDPSETIVLKKSVKDVVCTILNDAFASGKLTDIELSNIREFLISCRYDPRMAVQKENTENKS